MAEKEDVPVTSKPKPFDTQYEPIPIMPGSVEQEAIWKFALEETPHIVVNAGPGSGKTWQAIQYCLRAPKELRILFVAFNRHIAAEANGKLIASGCGNVRASTFHSLGFRMLREHFQNLREPNQNKMTEILETLNPAPLGDKAQWRFGINTAKRLVGFAKNYALDRHAPNFEKEMERLADHHAMDINGDFKAALALVRPALEECIRRAETSIDFDDMIWLPVVLDLPYPERADVVITDEAQDFNTIQHDLTMRLATPLRKWATGTRMIVVGDKRQAIYGFRGALTASIERLAARLATTDRGVREFPLTVTRRCPKSHVMLARNVFPECALCGKIEAAPEHSVDEDDGSRHKFIPTIQALDDAPEGEILRMSESKAVDEMRPGDLAICRINAALVPTAYALIRRGVRPIIKGRDIGTGLVSLLDKLAEMIAGSETETTEKEQSRLMYALSLYRQDQEAKLIPLGEKAKGRLSALRDKCDCMGEFIAQSKTATDIRQKIESIFSDDVSPNAVVLGTVHRTKGLEAERVFILSPDLIPHPLARKEWEQEQERNLAWVAVTRAKFDRKTGACGTLVFCGLVSSIYGEVTTTDSDRARQACSDLRQLGKKLEGPPAPPDFLSGGEDED